MSPRRLRPLRCTAALGALVACPLGASPAHAQLPDACHGGRQDAPAMEMARTAETTAEVYATDYNGSYAGISPAVLHRYEPYLAIRRTHTHPYLAHAAGTAHGYRVTVVAPDGNTFTITNRDGNITRTWTGHMGPGCTSARHATW
jgi:hypothetical protein